MSNEYELARDNRQDLIFTKEQLLAPLLPGMERPPHAMRLGNSEKDYYVGALTNPGTSAGAERAPLGPGDYTVDEHPGVTFPGAEQQATRAAATADSAGKGQS
jgi:NADH-quinone oxidoreductase subunit I